METLYSLFSNYVDEKTKIGKGKNYSEKFYLVI